MGGNLVSIPSTQVEAFLTNQMVERPAYDHWIGLFSSKIRWFFWIDGQKKQYSNIDTKVKHPWLKQLLRDHKQKRKFQFYSGHFDNEKICIAFHTDKIFGTAKWIQKSCNDTNGYICHQNIKSSLKDTTGSTVPEDYVRILNNSIKAITQLMTWDKARQHCEGDGAKLISLQSGWLHSYVELLAVKLKTRLWIGLNKLQTGGYFRFIDGWHVIFSRWGIDEPSRERPCVYVDVDGKWKTAYCNETMNSVCMKSTDVPPTDSSDYPGFCPEEAQSSVDEHFFWIPYKGYCYKFFTETETWSDACAGCVEHGASIASIEDPLEQEFIKNHIKIFEDSHSSFWIGLYKNSRGEWKWFDGSVVDYANWGNDRPLGHSHVEISVSDGIWVTAKPDVYRAYICKKRKVPLPTSSPPSIPDTMESLQHSYAALTAVLVIAGIALVAVVGVIILRRCYPLPVLENFTFHNPLFLSKEQGRSDNTYMVAENVDEES